MDVMIEKVKKVIAICLIRVFNCFPIKSNKVFLYSYYGSQYGCNPKYITEYILQNTSKGKFDLVWAFNDLSQFTHLTEIRKVKTMSLRYFYELCTSKVIITNFRTTDLFIKRKNQYYIQTWHSSLRLKQIEKDAESSLPKKYVEMAKKDSQKCDLLISGCEYSTKIFRRAFWYDGEILESGTPRNDIFFKKAAHCKRAIFKNLNIPDNVKVVLYAPTFRRDNNLEVYNIEFESLITSLKKKFGGEWKCFVKLHPHLKAQAQQLTYRNNVINVTHYDDIQELLSITDLLITDYSSLMFDFSFTGRPCFLYIPDAKKYIKEDRALYFNLLELPFIKAVNNKELRMEIQSFNSKAYKKDLKKFQGKIGSYEKGKACERLLNRVNKVCLSQNRREKHEAV